MDKDAWKSTKEGVRIAQNDGFRLEKAVKQGEREAENGVRFQEKGGAAEKPLARMSYWRYTIKTD